jgi:AraC-like DNA-binding protein
MNETSGQVAYRALGRTAPNLPRSGNVSRPDFVRLEALRGYQEVVRECGANPAELLKQAGIEPRLLDEADVVIPYRALVCLLEQTSKVLHCPDFGLRLASRQHPSGIMGALDLAMRNSRTLGDAFRYSAEYSHVYCAGVVLNSIFDKQNHWVLQWQVLLDRIPEHTQACEHAELVTYLAIQHMARGQARVKEIWFKHEPLCDAENYRRYFEAPVYFARPYSGLLLDAEDEQRPIVGRDTKVYSLATRLLDIEFPRQQLPLKLRVKRMIYDRLAFRGQLEKMVAEGLAMHPRTLQRRLREDGTSFDSIKDEVRREAAWQYLTQTKLPLTTIAGLLGYSEHSAFCRSCTRWFASSPGALRQRPEYTSAAS